jgi:hypothetical protein
MKYPNILKNFLRRPSIINILNFFLLKYLKLKKIHPPELSGPGRFFMVNPDDIFIFSYMRSGNVWLRFFIANLIFQKEKINLSNVNDYIGELAITNEKKLLKQKKPRIYSGHDYFDPRFKKVIYLIRDPRDVLTSLYPYLISLGVISKKCSKTNFLKKYFKEEFNANFGSWNDNVGSWIGINNEKKIIIIKYENLAKNILKESLKICKFLEIKKTKKQINTAIKKSGVFKGEVGLWKNFFSKNDINQIKKHCGKNMKFLGYK